MEYTLRRSRRARNLKIRVSPQHGVELVVPGGVSEAEATRFLHTRLDWVRRVRADMALPETDHGWPERVALAAVGRVVTVEPGNTRRLSASPERLILPRAWSPERVADALRDWLRQQARPHLAAYCRRLADAAGLEYARVRVGLQSSRWGSYSSRGTLSLNAKLMLLPDPVVRYVIHHELTHSLHMNHSAAFWAALARHEPEWRGLRASLRALGATLPMWVQIGHRKGVKRRLAGG